MHELSDLLEYISTNSFPTFATVGNWQFKKVLGGANNLLYKAEQEAKCFAVKFTIADTRNRAGREFNALQVLSQLEPKLAPEAVLLDNTSYVNPVVVQSWIDGKVLQKPPQTDSEWFRFLSHYTNFHSIDISKTDVDLQRSYLTASSVTEGIALVTKQVNYLPSEVISKELEQKVSNLKKLLIHSFKNPITLCRTDSNFRNFILQDTKLLSVDWENSGWGNPHFEIAELITHAAYLSVDTNRWDWIVNEYANMIASQTVKEAITIYSHIMLVFWLALFTRYIYELSQGNDKRLTKANFHNIEEMQYKYDLYLQRVERSESNLL